jgi:predicted Fe-S protein YdhL (DUF1289 family)
MTAPGSAARGGPGAVASPCIDVCVLDRAGGRCQGCLRTMAEIAAWPTADDDWKRSVLARIEERRREQG